MKNQSPSTGNYNLVIETCWDFVNRNLHLDSLSLFETLRLWNRYGSVLTRVEIYYFDCVWCEQRNMSHLDPENDPSIHRLEGSSENEQGGLIIMKKGPSSQQDKHVFKVGHLWSVLRSPFWHLVQGERYDFHSTVRHPMKFSGFHLSKSNSSSSWVTRVSFCDSRSSTSFCAFPFSQTSWIHNAGEPQFCENWE